jgi:hypothetical protein
MPIPNEPVVQDERGIEPTIKQEEDKVGFDPTIPQDPKPGDDTTEIETQEQREARMKIPDDMAELHKHIGDEGIAQIVRDAAQKHASETQKAQALAQQRAQKAIAEQRTNESHAAKQQYDDIMERGFHALGEAAYTEQGQEQLRNLHFQAMHKVFTADVGRRVNEGIQNYVQQQAYSERQTKAIKQKALRETPEMRKAWPLVEQLLDEGYDAKVVIPQMKRTLQSLGQLGLINPKDEEGRDDYDEYDDAVEGQIRNMRSRGAPYTGAGQRSLSVVKKRDTAKQEDEANESLFSSWWGPKVKQQ